ncbi:NAD(P)-dependent oxidoreductase [Mangrovibacter phragmitis]|uniref:NAD(P)-dependent oxidoreductase n=1 Tax=Mangrovibacter phragmitis TaxID=1691903 RepID=UPI0035183828
MAKVTFLGTGAMGSRMAMNLLKAGHDVTVWNRTPETAAPLVDAGAGQAFTPREAVAQAGVIISVLRDDEASREVWLNPEWGALAGMPASAIAIESSTLTVSWVRELAQIMSSRDRPFLEAPVSGSRPQADNASLIYFVGGYEGYVDHVRSLLLQMGSDVFYVGSHGAAAMSKLATNTLLGVQVAALAETIAILIREGVDVARVLDAVAGTASWSPMAGRVARSMLTQQFAPLFPVELIEKDLDYMLRSADEEVTEMPAISGARDAFRKAMAQGLGEEDMSGVVRLFVK